MLGLACIMQLSVRLHWNQDMCDVKNIYAFETKSSLYDKPSLELTPQILEGQHHYLCLKYHCKHCSIFTNVSQKIRMDEHKNVLPPFFLTRKKSLQIQSFV